MTRYSLIPAAYVYMVRDGRVLLQLRRNTGYMDGFWTAGAAGHLEPGETAVQAATRELSEELGLSVSASELVPSAVMQRTDGTSNPREQRVDWFFACASWSGEPSIMEPEKCAELRWFDLTDLPPQIPAYERAALVWLRENDSVGLLDVGFSLPRT
ncbi:DNA mismatch repair protein MutT [Microbacterium sp. B35-04]|uniref:NUDIX hydrolase n=1 Tax=Microbacterium sp. B35-04 TaxID=1961716 RepID=UPI0023BA7EEC|nr:NUDIX domain-containing protein [Microbacterium sp. B35-04]KAF2412919.1 DNA mismatch repair protein MutT [Microbacterium sp. B35-04]